MIRRLARGVLWTLSLAALFVLVGVAFITPQLRGSLPQLDGRLEVAELGAPVSISRDALGVVTVRGGNRVDIARATGFAHARDRFFQMDGARRLAAGELSALVGASTLAIDLERRVHRSREVARRALALAGPGQRALLQAYAEGVNAGLASLSHAPPEYLLLPGKPEPWRAEDSLLVVLAMAYQLTDEMAERDRERGRLDAALPAALVSFLLPAESSWDAPLDGTTLASPAPLPGPAVCDLRSRAQVAESERERRRLAGDPYPVAAGSNAWVVGGERTASGLPLLANDMHLALRVPNTWYRMRLVLATAEAAPAAMDVSGATLPGAPAVVVGSNGQVAWGFTNSYGDWSDRIRLELDAEEPSRYRTASGFRTFESVRERILVADGESVDLLIEQTVWGPVVERDAEGRPLQALRWLGHRPGAIDIRLLDLERAHDVDEALAVAHQAGIPPQNFHVADRGGAFAWSIAGRVPLRSDYDTTRPVSGADGHGWRGWLPVERYPVIRPVGDGMVWTANSRVVGGEALQLIGAGAYHVGARATQIRDRLQTLLRASAADMLSLQLDDRGLFLARWRELLLATLNAGSAPAGGARARMRELVAGWEERALPDSAAYRLVREFRGRVHERVLSAVLKGCAVPGAGAVTLARERRREAPLWALVTSRPAHLLAPGYDSWQALLLAAADEVIAGCGNRALAECTWGELNRVHIEHPFSRTLPLLADWLDPQNAALPGDSYTPRMQRPRAGASQRMAVSPGREEEGYFHMPAGQSGHFLSPFYRAGHEAWADGRPLPFLPGSDVHSLLLVPPTR